LKFDIVTIFPGMVAPILREGILARAIERGLIDVAVFDLRDFTTDRHRVVDDTPFGGGPGMVLKPEPFFRALAHIRQTRGEPTAVVLPTPQGKPFTHAGTRSQPRKSRSATTCCRAASWRRWSSSTPPRA
jgi:tRNA (guanine37-N1)-methyltransferase